jgi:SNF2 family DNA or RNA helicase
MDERVRDAIADKGLAKSHIIVLDALLKLRQICCHPQLLKSEAAQRVTESAKLEFLTSELLPRSSRKAAASCSSRSSPRCSNSSKSISNWKHPLPQTHRPDQGARPLVKKFQSGEVPIFLISLKAGGTGLNLTAADTVIHYDPWWNPAAENQATDRAHRIGQTKPVFVHKLVCRGTIEDRILELQEAQVRPRRGAALRRNHQTQDRPETLSHLKNSRTSATTSS